jgi:hypothetical protein
MEHPMSQSFDARKSLTALAGSVRSQRPWPATRWSTTSTAISHQLTGDNGVGIPPEYRDKLFQPFFTTKPTCEGTGLGLSISYEIVTQQHEMSIANPPQARQPPRQRRFWSGSQLSHDANGINYDRLIAVA